MSLKEGFFSRLAATEHGGESFFIFRIFQSFSGHRIESLLGRAASSGRPGTYAYVDWMKSTREHPADLLRGWEPLRVVPTAQRGASASFLSDGTRACSRAFFSRQHAPSGDSAARSAPP